MNSSNVSPESIIDFWFSKKVSKLWFKSTPEFDDVIRQRFEKTWVKACNNELSHWKESANGIRALIIALDQFPLNMYRGKAISYSSENQAIDIARYAIEKNYDQEFTGEKLQFLYMPFMHSENLNDQHLSVELFEKTGLDNNIRFAKHHRDIIKRFGRFPHRNKTLHRTNTKEETEYLNSPKAFKG